MREANRKGSDRLRIKRRSLGLLHQSNDDRDHGKDHQDVNKTPEEMEPEPADQPEHEQNNGNSVEHNNLSSAAGPEEGFKFTTHDSRRRHLS